MLWGAPTPSRADPSRLIQTPPAVVAISGRLLADVRHFPSGCSGLLEVDRIEAHRAKGRTELQLADCSAPLLQGWGVRAVGALRRPRPGLHPLLPGSAERLARQASWSQLRVDSIEVLERPWTPLPDLRRHVAQRLQLADGLVAVERFGRHWLLARHRGRAALVSTHGDGQACRMAQRLAAVHGHPRLDWVMLLDPVAPDVLPCWKPLAGHVQAAQQGRPPLAAGQMLRSDGLSVHRVQQRAGTLVLQAGRQRWQLIPRPQALWSLQEQQRSGFQRPFKGTWLGFKPSAVQRRWLLKH
ncbi:hypothetical protein [Synechococcus sp. KORDI-52]|uniref:hypothetical protein n=1 Tax=Synechococcus sp. KORDI-52 TaxID=585425 RepID=UPI0020A62F29|nr:hypothetical protein [Synechococcus sp. KORDI-52]